MIRLNSIYIKGFKDPEEEKYLEFSPEPISVIYGENGSGKTTLLKILFAVLSGNEDMLLEEKVQEIKLRYKKDNTDGILTIRRQEFTGLPKNYKWNDSDFLDTSSVLFDVHRGIVQQENNNSWELVEDLLNNMQSVISREKNKNANITKTSLYQSIEDLLDMALRRITFQGQHQNIIRRTNFESHLFISFLDIRDVAELITNEYRKGQEFISQKIKNAFFDTISQAVDIEEKQEINFALPQDFNTRIQQHKNFILQAMKQENSSLVNRVEAYLNTNDKKLIQKSKIFRAMLLNMIEEAEKPNPSLESITKLIKIFNEHLYKNKKLVVNEEEVYIYLGNEKKHELEDLSSGERNLLSILTLFLIIGQNRNFLIIDEPELSLNMKWQREFLPLLNEINPNAQIIVASHSPSISRKNTRYLTELK